MFCRSCGNKLDDDALFCMNCGAKISDTVIAKYCAHCGTELEDDVVFCMSCGKKVQEEEMESEEKIETESAATAVLIETPQKETSEINPVEVEYEVAQNSPEMKKMFFIVAKDWKKFAAIRGGNPSDYYCPNCHIQVNSSSDSCTKCGASFYDWGKSKGLNDNAGETSEKLAENKKSNEMTGIHIFDVMKENSSSGKETTEDKTQSKIGYVFLIAVIFIVLAIVAGLSFSENNKKSVQTSTSNGASNTNTFNFDHLKPYTFKSDDGSYEYDCYNLSKGTLSSLWNNPPRYFTYNTKKYEVDNRNIDYDDVDEDDNEYNAIICWGDYDGTYYHFLGVGIKNGSKSMWLWKL